MKLKDQTPDIQFLIDDEFEAIEGYKKAISQTNDPAIIKVLSHIMDEEKEHVSELKLLVAKANVGDSLKTKMFTKDELKNLNTLSKKLRDERFEFAVYAKDPHNRDNEINALNKKYPSAYIRIHGPEEIRFESSNQNELQKIMNEISKTYKISPWRGCDYTKKVEMI